MTATLHHHPLGRGARGAAVLLATLVALAAVALVVLALVAGVGGDSLAPVDTLAPAAPGWSPASPETVAS